MDIPEDILEKLARIVLECAYEYFKDPEHQKEYEKWLQERNEKNISKKSQ
jgi:hypothetical protein